MAWRRRAVRVLHRGGPGSIYGGQSGTGTGFSQSFRIFIDHYRFPKCIYCLGHDEWPQFRETVSTHQVIDKAVIQAYLLNK
jgi:hypothetical protein